MNLTLVRRLSLTTKLLHIFYLIRWLSQELFYFSLKNFVAQGIVILCSVVGIGIVGIGVDAVTNFVHRKNLRIVIGIDLLFLIGWYE